MKTSTRKKTILLLLFIGGLIMQVHATIWYVNSDAVGMNDGTTWNDAFTDLQDGIDASSFGDEIWVAAGTYKPTSGNSETVSFRPKNGTTIYGGFDGTETMLTQRDFVVNETILSGEIGSGSANDNSNNVVYFKNAATQTILDGFDIKGGNGDYGGGILSDDSSPTIKNCRIMGNYAATAGGGLCHSDGNITIKNCIFEGNVSGQGGAINLFSGANNKISNSYFKSNQSTGHGGAIAISPTSQTKLTVTSSVFAGNNADVSTIYFNSSGLLLMYDCLLVGNYSNSSGTIDTETSSNSQNNKLVNCTIANNDQGSTSSFSSSVHLNKQSTIVNSIIYGNTGNHQVLNTGLTIQNCILQSGTNTPTGSTIINDDPQFLLPKNANDAPFDTTGVNYHLATMSAGIDFGLNSAVYGSSDLMGNTRIQNTTVDLGAFENNYCASPLTLSENAPYVVCSNLSTTLSVSGTSDIRWSNGSTDTSITVSNPGVFSVVFKDTSGCRGTVEANVVDQTPQPTITYSNSEMKTGVYSTYQWYRDGNPISGATNQTYLPEGQVGSYTVKVTNSFGCEGTSSAYIIDNTGLSVNKIEKISVYPNPIYKDEKLTIELSSMTENNTKFVLYDMTGSVLLSKQINKASTILTLPMLEKGMYFISFYGQNKTLKNLKLIVQ